MNQPLDIERIVQEVLQRLMDSRAVSTPETVEPASTVGLLAIDDRVVSLRQVEGRLQGITTIQVSQRAVVTPAVRDLLRQRSVRLERTSSEMASGTLTAKAASPSSSSKSNVCVAFESPHPQLDRIAADQTCFAPSGSSPVPEMVTWLTRQLAEQAQYGVVVSHRAMLVAAAANRQSTLRAAVVQTAADATKAVQQMDANVWVLASPLAPEFRRVLRVAADLASQRSSGSNAARVWEEATR